MSGNNNSKNSTNLTTKKRGLNSSLTLEQISPDKDSKSKAVKMAEPADKEDIKEVKNLIASNTKALNETIATLSNNILTLTAQITSINKNVEKIEARVVKLENAGNKDKLEMEDISAELNAIKQMKLDSQLSILNSPLSIDVKQALENISSWTSMQLNDSNVRRAVIVKPKEKSSAILQLDFYDLSVKDKLMKHVRNKQRDDNKKYVPIMAETIFNVESMDPGIGTELHFRESFTETNRDIYNAAKKHKDIFVGVWINRGYINVKQENGNPIKIKSLKQLNSLIESLKQSISMEH